MMIAKVSNANVIVGNRNYISRQTVKVIFLQVTFAIRHCVQTVDSIYLFFLHEYGSWFQNTEQL